MDNRLHDLVAESCGNSLLAKEIGRLKTLFRVFRDLAWEHEEACNDFHRLAEEAREHFASSRRCWPATGKRQFTMARHIGSGIRYWCRAMPTRPAAAAKDKKDCVIGRGADMRAVAMKGYGKVWMGAAVAAYAVFCSASACAGDKLEYNRDVRPIFAENCFACHGTDSTARKADLLLTAAPTPLNPRRSSLASRTTASWSSASSRT